MLLRARDGVVRAIDWLTTAGGYLASLATVLILALVCVEVFLRNVVGSSTQVSDEMSGYLNVAIIYLGLAYTLKHGGFIRVDIVYQRFRGPLGLAVRWLIVLVSLGYILVILYYMAGYVEENYRIGTTAFSVMETPVWIPQVLVLAGSAILALQLLAYLLKGGRDVP